MFVESTHTSVNHCNKRGVLQRERTGGELSRRELLSEGEVFREKVSRGDMSYTRVDCTVHTTNAVNTIHPADTFTSRTPYAAAVVYKLIRL